MADDAKEKLIDFLNRKAFEPVLRANPDDYPEDKRRKLEDVKEATRAEQERFRNYDSAREIYQMFRDDLNSEPAHKIHRELRDLDLPTLKDIQRDFEQLAKDVGVSL